MSQPKYFRSQLTVTGSDSVDELVRRCGGNFQHAESIVHSMVTNYLAFDDMRRGKEVDAVQRAEDALNNARVELAVAASKGACAVSLQTHLEKVALLENEWERTKNGQVRRYRVRRYT